MIKVDLDQKYQPEIKGLGEIYEIASVRHRQKRLKKKFGRGFLFLSANKDHRGRGMTLKALEKKVRQKGYQVLESGWVDSSLFPSCPRQGENKSPLLNYSLVVVLAKLVFKFLVMVEFLWQSEKVSHMVYVLGKPSSTGSSV